MIVRRKTNNNIFRLIRLARDLRTSDVASMMGCTTAYVSQVENGERKPTVEWIGDFCKKLDVREDVVQHFDNNSEGTFERKMLSVLQTICDMEDNE